MCLGFCYILPLWGTSKSSKGWKRVYVFFPALFFFSLPVPPRYELSMERKSIKRKALKRRGHPVLKSLRWANVSAPLPIGVKLCCLTHWAHMRTLAVITPKQLEKPNKCFRVIFKHLQLTGGETKNPWTLQLVSAYLSITRTEKQFYSLMWIKFSATLFCSAQP